MIASFLLIFEPIIEISKLSPSLLLEFTLILFDKLEKEFFLEVLLIKYSFVTVSSNAYTVKIKSSVSKGYDESKVIFFF